MSKFLYLKYQDWKVLNSVDVELSFDAEIKSAAVASVTVSENPIKLWVVDIVYDTLDLSYDEILDRLNQDFNDALDGRHFVLGVKYA